jgi:membrane protease YdiL (CAAX protease family)
VNRNAVALARVALYLAGVVVLGCLMAPVLFRAGNGLAQAGVLPFLEGFPFHRYFSRSMQIAALVLLWPAFRWVGLSRLSDLNLLPDGRRWRHLASGVFFALLPVVVLGVSYVIFDVYRMRGEPAFSGLVRIVGTASVVAVIEEFLMRGVVLGLLLRAVGPPAAVVVSSVVFAGVHFMKVARSGEAVEVTWLSGFQQLPLVFSAAPEWPLLGWGIASLVVAGVILALVTLRTRSLFAAIGLHAGWILGQQGIQWMAKYAVAPPLGLLPWVGPNVVSGAVPTGIVPLVTLLVCGAGMFFVLRREMEGHR